MTKRKINWDADAKRKLAKGPTPHDTFMDLRASRWLEVVEARKAQQPIRSPKPVKPMGPHPTNSDKPPWC